MRKVFRPLLPLIIVSIVASCKKNISPNNSSTNDTTISNNTDTTVIFGKWQWDYDVIINETGSNDTSYRSYDSLMLVIDSNKTYIVTLKESTITTGAFSDTTANYLNERIVTFQNPFNINSIDFDMATNIQLVLRVNATKLLSTDYMPYDVGDGHRVHYFKLIE